MYATKQAIQKMHVIHTHIHTSQRFKQDIQNAKQYCYKSDVKKNMYIRWIHTKLVK